jgi:membrane-associated protein
MDDLFSQVWDLLSTIVLNLKNPDAWKESLGKPGVFWAAVVTLAAIIFAETGLLVGFFLPGDSLLVTVGIVAHLSDWNIGILLAVLTAAAIIGDTVGYWFGAKAGPAIFNRPSSRWFKRDHLLAAKDFYDRHGGKTIIMARFMPFVRTFAPVVAGAAKMEYRTFLFYNVIGGVAWIASMLLFGYTLHLWADALLRPIFGPTFRIEKNIDILAGLIILASISPLIVKGLSAWRTNRRAKLPTPGAPVG